MPLPPLPANNTDRAWLGYTYLGQQHEVVFRFPSATTQANIIAACASFANAMKGLIESTDSFNKLRHQDSGSTVSFPLTWTSIAGTSSGSSDGDDKARFIAVSGRSLAGYRCRLTLFTGAPPDSQGFRLNRATGNTADTFLAALEAMPTAPVAIDGQAVVWNQYVNEGYNSYWQRQFR